MQALRTSQILCDFIADSRRWAISVNAPFLGRSRALMRSLSENCARFLRGGASVSKVNLASDNLCRARPRASVHLRNLKQSQEQAGKGEVFMSAGRVVEDTVAMRFRVPKLNDTLE